jgi:RecA-family ATPase
MNGPSFDQTYLDSLTDLGEPIGAQAREKKRQLALVNAASLADKQIPEREWLVDEIIPMRQVTLIYGDGATGKTLIELQLSVAVATGTNWLGKLPKEGNVLILSAEDDIDETHRRLADIVVGREFSMADLSGLTIAPLAGEDALLAVSGRGGILSATDLFAEVEATVQDIQPIMLAIDTLADTFGGDEINRAHARQFIKMLRGLAVKFNMAVVVLAHPSLSGMASGAGTSGNTGWSNSVRSRLYLEPVKTDTGGVPDDTLRRLTVKKVNYAKVGTEIMMRWGRGRFVLAASDWKSSLTIAEIDNLFLELWNNSPGRGGISRQQKAPPMRLRNLPPTPTLRASAKRHSRKRWIGFWEQPKLKT